MHMCVWVCVKHAYCCLLQQTQPFSMLPIKLCLSDGLTFRGDAEIFGLGHLQYLRRRLCIFIDMWHVGVLMEKEIKNSALIVQLLLG